MFGTQTKGNVKNFGPTNLVTHGGSLLDEEHMEDPRNLDKEHMGAPSEGNTQRNIHKFPFLGGSSH